MGKCLSLLKSFNRAISHPCCIFSTKRQPESHCLELLPEYFYSYGALRIFLYVYNIVFVIFHHILLYFIHILNSSNFSLGLVLSDKWNQTMKINSLNLSLLLIIISTGKEIRKVLFSVEFFYHSFYLVMLSSKSLDKKSREKTNSLFIYFFSVHYPC